MAKDIATKLEDAFGRAFVSVETNTVSLPNNTRSEIRCQMCFKYLQHRIYRCARGHFICEMYRTFVSKYHICGHEVRQIRNVVL